MLRKILAVAGSIIFLWGFNVVRAAELEMRPFLYTQDFEEVDPVEPWAAFGGEYIINFKGLTEEKSFSGRKSFKLDITVKEGASFYWRIPLPERVPAAGKLKFSGRIFLGEESTGRARLGANVSFSPGLDSSAGRSFEYVKKGEWQLIERNLITYAKGLVKDNVLKRVWGARVDDVGIHIDKVGIFLFGSPGQRIVVYVDDIKIEGEVPTAAAYEEEMKRRWAPVKERFNEKTSSWERALKEGGKELASLTNLSPEAEKMKKSTGEKIDSFEIKVEEINRRGWISLSERREIDSFLGQLKTIIFNIKAIASR